MNAPHQAPIETIGDRIRKVRELRGLSQSELARRANGISSQAINMIENGQTRSPTPENLFYIADALETDARELVFGLRPSTLSTAQALARVVDMLPDESRQQALNFSFYTAERSAHLIASEKLKSYTSMMENIRQDMEQKKPGAL